jgi:hypothetical protein
VGLRWKKGKHRRDPDGKDMAHARKLLTRIVFGNGAC